MAQNNSTSQLLIDSTVAGAQFNILVRFDENCSECDRDDLIKQCASLISAAINPFNPKNLTQAALVKKLRAGNPYRIYVHCKDGGKLNALSLFDKPNYEDRSHTLVDMGLMTVG